MTAQIDPTFAKRIVDLQTLSQQVSAAETTANQQRVWMVPSDWVGDPFLIPSQHLPSFDRTAINQQYQDVLTDDLSNVGDAASLQTQLAYMATMERAFRFRHASHIRCIMHAGARHAGQGNAAGVFGAVQNYAQDLIKAGGA